MKNKPFILLIIASAASGFLFFEQAFGLNVLLLTILIVTLWYTNRPEWVKSRRTAVVIAGMLASSVSVAVGASSFSSMVFAAFALAAAGTLCFGQVSTFTAIWHGLYALCTSHLAFLAGRRKQPSSTRVWSVLKVSAVPILIVSCFLLLYYRGSPVFASLIDMASPQKPSSFFWFCMGCGLLLFGTFYPNENWKLKLWESKKTDILTRTGLKKGRKHISSLHMGLRKESHRARLTLALLNLLLLSVIATDLYYMAGGKLPEDISYSEYVHQGINTLILSLVMAISLILFHFRGALNFFSANKPARINAKIWLLQNMLLAGLCAYRNYLYVSEYGLTYKRIGVWIYILLVITGLISTYIKVDRHFTLWKLFKLNFSMALWLFLLLSFVNWDGLIAKYNLYYARQTDFTYLLRLSYRVLPVMNDHEEKAWWPEGVKERVERRTDYKRRQIGMKDIQSLTYLEYKLNLNENSIYKER